MPQVTRRLTYRTASFTIPLQQQNLEGLLTAALNAQVLAEQRERLVRPDDQVRQVLNQHYRIGNSLCGMVCQYVPGQNQMAFDRVNGAQDWAIHEVAPPPPIDDQGAPVNAERNFLPSVLYFGVRGNHLVLMQTPGMLAGELAQFLTWFIRDQSGLTPQGQHITLEMASSQRLRQNGVAAAKAIRITKSLADVVVRPAPNPTPEVPTITEKIIPPGRSDAVTGMLQSLNVQLPANVMTGNGAEDLELYLEIRKPYSRDDHGHRVMNQIARLVALEDDSNYEVVLPNNGVLKGGDLKLSKPVTLNIANARSHPAPDPVFRQIDQYLNELIVSGAV